MAFTSLRELRQYANPRIFATLVAITLVALGATSVVIYCLHTVLRVRQESIDLTKIQTQLNAFNVELLNAETGQRGYLLTGDESYREPYLEAVRQIPSLGVQQTKASSPYAYAAKAAQLNAVAKDKLDEMSQTVSLQQAGNHDAALALVGTNRGQTDMAKIRSLVAEISKQQADELVAKRAITTKYGNLANWIAGGMLVVIALLAGLVYYLFLQAIKSERSL